jgi:hypothetical protein
MQIWKMKMIGTPYVGKLRVRFGLIRGTILRSQLNGRNGGAFIETSPLDIRVIQMLCHSQPTVIFNRRVEGEKVHF